MLGHKDTGEYTTVSLDYLDLYLLSQLLDRRDQGSIMGLQLPLPLSIATDMPSYTVIRHHVMLSYIVMHCHNMYEHIKCFFPHTPHLAASSRAFSFCCFICSNFASFGLMASATPTRRWAETNLHFHPLVQLL